MKNLIWVLVVLITTVGCSSLTSWNKRVFGKASQKQETAVNKINESETKAALNKTERLEQIGVWATGTDVALQKATNEEPAITVAKDINERVIALAEKPDFKEQQEMIKLVNTLITNQIAGSKMLAEKDKIIINLNKEAEKIEQTKQEQINNALELAQKNAASADQYKATLTEMDTFWGGGAVWYGLKKFFTKTLWAIGICILIYIVLRIASAFNPIAAALFGIVDTIFGVIVKMIQGIAPKAVHAAGYVESKLFNDYKGTLTHIVQAIQLMKVKEEAGTDVTMDAILTEAEKLMDQSDKDRITEIKKSLNWK